mgnify:CR=1 FL=1
MQKEIKTNCDVPALWLEHKNELRSFILKRVKDQDLTNDVLQEVLMKVYSFCISKSGVRNVRSWLFQIAQNTITDHYRKQSKFTNLDNLADIENEDQKIAFSEAANYILPMLEFLPKEYAVPLKFADIDNLKQADIAKKLNLSLPATKSRIQRGARMRKQYRFALTISFLDNSSHSSYNSCLEAKLLPQPLLTQPWLGPKCSRGQAGR